MNDLRLSMDDLRHMLFTVQNQEMSVRELRTVLFNYPNADVEMNAASISLNLNIITQKWGETK